MEDAWSTYKDRDGNFREQLQTTGFDARVWELYLHAYFTDSGLLKDQEQSVPDFVLECSGERVCVEAVTTNPSSVGELTDAVRRRDGESDDEYVKRQYTNVLPMKLGSALYAKLQKRYWELPQGGESPLLFAVESFHSEDSLIFTSGALQRYLFGLDWAWHHDERGKLQVTTEDVVEHIHGQKEIPSGFFSLPEADRIAGVIFSNHGTTAKFSRMGHQGAYRLDDIRMWRQGTAYDMSDPDTTMPLVFQYEVGDGTHVEPWGEGVTVFLNPFARHPLSGPVFPDALHVTMDGDAVLLIPIPFHPFGSKTVILQPRSEA
jgi:hypothetical protein